MENCWRSLCVCFPDKDIEKGSRVGKEKEVEEVGEENDIYIGIMPVPFYL